MDSMGTGPAFGGPDGGEPWHEEPAAPETAFAFEGNWRDFAKIAFTNLLLTIVTLGIYRFWATTRERQYLWSRTRFIDDHLEWTGRGKELFFGFLLATVLIILPFALINMITQGLIFRGNEGVAAGVFIASFLVLFYFSGVARFRALRYRLGRTHWRGIRGGSYDQGFKYGLSHMWKYTVGYLALGLMVPWAMVSLWNERWNKMSFGQLSFRSEADFSPLMKRYLLVYLAPFVLFIAMFALLAAVTFGFGGMENENTALGITVAALTVILMVGVYAGWGIVYLAFYAKYMRIVIGEMKLGENIEFGFHASTKDWLKLIAVDIGLVLVTLGVGYIFLTYRHWKFFITHLEAYGEVDPDALTQSETPMSKHGEGLLDAFDMGAI